MKILQHSLHWLQHEPYETLGVLATWAKRRGITCERSRPYLGEPLPHLDEIDWLVVMGGSMSTCDEARFPWLVAEKELIRDAITRGTRVLGICLGAQMIAEVLGGNVRRGPFKEIGWHRVMLTEGGKKSNVFQHFPWGFQAFHWHGDVFEIPDDCVRLAESEGYMNQAFSYGENVVGLQFHLEVSASDVDAMLAAAGGDLESGGPFVQSEVRIRQLQASMVSARPLASLLMDNLATVPATPTSAT